LGLERDATFENALINRGYAQKIVSEEESMRAFYQLYHAPSTSITHALCVNC
jgi:hypothetical protein